MKSVIDVIDVIVKSVPRKRGKGEAGWRPPQRPPFLHYRKFSKNTLTSMTSMTRPIISMGYKIGIYDGALTSMTHSPPFLTGAIDTQSEVQSDKDNTGADVATGRILQNLWPTFFGGRPAGPNQKRPSYSAKISMVQKWAHGRGVCRRGAAWTGRPNGLARGVWCGSFLWGARNCSFSEPGYLAHARFRK